MLKAHVYRLTAYPKDVDLGDGKRVTLRPMTEADEEALLAFFTKLPAGDRFYLKGDVASPQLIHEWATTLDYDRVLPVLALSGDQVVADATLHRSRVGARRHVGQVRITVAPDYREAGLGMTMLQELAAIANDNDLDRLLLEAVVEKEHQAIDAAERVGFVKEGLLPGHAKDLDGHLRDVVLLEMPLGKWLEWWRAP